MIYQYSGIPQLTHDNVRQTESGVMANRPLEDPGLTLIDKFDGAVNVGAGGLKRQQIKEKTTVEITTFSDTGDRPENIGFVPTVGPTWNGGQSPRPEPTGGRRFRLNTGLFGKLAAAIGLTAVASMVLPGIANPIMMLGKASGLAGLLGAGMAGSLSMGENPSPILPDVPEIPDATETVIL